MTTQTDSNEASTAAEPEGIVNAPQEAVSPSPAPYFQYAVKFVCGSASGGYVARGTYFTAINVHNPTPNQVNFKKKFALPGDRAEKPGRFTEFFPAALGYDEVLEIDCRDIFDHTNSISTAPFRKGFVVIVSEVELDVVAVYSAAGLFGRVKTLHIEQVPPSSTHQSTGPTSDPFATGGFTVDPGDTFPALIVPGDRTFILTDVIIFPLVESSNPDFVVRYRIEENTATKFQYNTVGTATNWSQHFSSGIKFAAGSTVNVVNTTFSTGRTGFQLLGYFTVP